MASHPAGSPPAECAGLWSQRPQIFPSGNTRVRVSQSLLPICLHLIRERGMGPFHYYETNDFFAQEFSLYSNRLVP